MFQKKYLWRMLFLCIFFLHTMNLQAESVIHEDNLKNLPTLHFQIDESQGTIEAMNSDPNHQKECYGTFTLSLPEKYLCEYGNEDFCTFTPKEIYELEYIRGRGNQSWKGLKKPYKIKLTKKADFFHMGKNKHWVLLADYFDPSHMRNKITYALAEKMGMLYTPQGVYVNVFFNEEYIGTYLLAEQVRIGEGRVEIPNLEDIPEETSSDRITGGYMLSLKRDNKADGKHILTKRKEEFLLENPSFEDYENETQYNYICDYIQKTEDALYGKDFCDQNGVSYQEYMDIDAAVDYYLVQLISMNKDAFRTNSTFLYKADHGKLIWGPLWDFDMVAWGNNEFPGLGIYYRSLTLSNESWFHRMLQDSDFVDRIKKRWPLVKGALIEIYEENGLIDHYAKMLNGPLQEDARLYGRNYVKSLQDKTFEDQVDQLKNWIKIRCEWLDNNLQSLKPYPDEYVDENAEEAGHHGAPSSSEDPGNHTGASSTESTAVNHTGASSTESTAVNHVTSASKTEQKKTNTSPVKPTKRKTSTKSSSSRIKHPVLKVNYSTINLKRGKSTRKLKVKKMAKRDYVKAWKSSNKKVFTVAGKKNGTCIIRAKKIRKKKMTAKLTIVLASGLKKKITIKVKR